MPIDDTKSSLRDMPVRILSIIFRAVSFKPLKVPFDDIFSVFLQGTDGSSMESGSVLDFMSMKSYPDVSLDMLNTLGESYITHQNFLLLML